MEHILSISGLRTQFDTKVGTVKAVDGIDLSIRPGETLGLVGESGSGKSVTAFSVMRLLEDPGEITAGSVTLSVGEDVQWFSDRHPTQVGQSIDPETETIDLLDAGEPLLRDIRGGEIGMIFQDPMTSLNPTMKIGHQVAESLQLHRYDSKPKDTWVNALQETIPRRSRMNSQLREDTIDLLTQVGLPEPARQLEEYPHSLSGGMRQRVLVALALACRPRLLIADEPTTALDVTIQAQILDLISELQREYGMAVLFITHDLGVVAEICDRVAVMYAGEIVEIGPVEEIFANPSHPYTYTLLESVPTEEKERLTPIEGNVPDLIDIGPGCTFAPRCPWAQEECYEGEIPFLQHGSEGVDHRSKCILDSIDTASYHRSVPPQQKESVRGVELMSVSQLRKYYHRGSGRLDRLLNRDSDWVKAVDGIDMRIYEGETVGLVGESGCGKSTFGRAILYLDPPTNGTVVYAGTELGELTEKELHERRKDMQMIFQDPLSSLNPRMTVAQALKEPLKIHGLAAGRRDERISELLEAVGLEAAQRDRYPHELSGGQAQRVGIARALAVDPDLIIADEPVSALDVSVQAQIINLLEDLQAEHDLTFLFIAHDLSVVRHISDRVAVMYLGKIVEFAETEELFTNPKHPYTQALLSAIPKPDPTRADDDRILLKGDVPSPVNPPSGCNFRTRCPKVIQPSDLQVDQERYRAIMNFRERIEYRDLDVDTLRSRAQSIADRRAIALDAAFSELIYDRLFESGLGGAAKANVDTAIEQLFNGEWEVAERTLRDRFESPCETREPGLDGGSHPTACHLFSDRADDVSD